MMTSPSFQNLLSLFQDLSPSEFYQELSQMSQHHTKISESIRYSEVVAMFQSSLLGHNLMISIVFEISMLIDVLHLI
jgi:hypothetical protein